MHGPKVVRWALALAVLALLLGGSVAATSPSLADNQTPAEARDATGAVDGHPGRVVFHRTKRQIGAAGNPFSGGNLAFHGGQTERITSTSYAIYWVPPGSAISDTYQGLLNRYFADVGGSGLYNTSTQYYDSAGNITNSSSFGGSVLDTSPFPSNGCNPYTTGGGAALTVCLSDAQLQVEVQSVIAAQHWTPNLSTIFYLFTPLNVGSCAGTSCAFTQYCAYHSAFTGSDGAPIIYANMPYTATDLGGCGTPSSPNGDVAADSTINVTSHEHMEAVTDPQLTAWWDSRGAEIGDKCAWKFGTVTNGANVVWNGHPYIVQQEWSNANSGCVLSYNPAPPTVTPAPTPTKRGKRP